MSTAYKELREQEERNIAQELIDATIGCDAGGSSRVMELTAQAAELAQAAAQAGDESLQQARQRLAQAALAAAEALETLEVEEPRGKVDSLEFAEALGRINREARRKVAPEYRAQNSSEQIAAYATLKDETRRVRSIAETMAREAKNRYEMGPARTASAGLAAAQAMVLAATAAGWLGENEARNRRSADARALTKASAHFLLSRVKHSCRFLLPH